MGGWYPPMPPSAAMDSSVKTPERAEAIPCPLCLPWLTQIALSAPRLRIGAANGFGGAGGGVWIVREASDCCQDSGRRFGIVRSVRATEKRVVRTCYIGWARSGPPLCWL